MADFQTIKILSAKSKTRYSSFMSGSFPGIGFGNNPSRSAPRCASTNGFAMFLLSMCWALLCGAQQSSQQIQQAMAAADSQKSAAVSPIYATPLKTFQAYYNGAQANDTAAIAGCLTAKCLKDAFGPNPPTTNQDFAKLNRSMNQQGANFAVTLFTFTPDAIHPVIKAAYCFTAVISGQSTKRTDSVTFTLIDTSTGWKIDTWAE